MNDFESPKPPSPEGRPEQAFSREKILSIIKKRLENFTVKRELYDAKGLYLLEVQSIPGASNESIQYEFMFQGEHEGHNQAVRSAIHVIYLRDNISIGGGLVAQYNPEIGEWQETR
jgi:hypothetical protein